MINLKTMLRFILLTATTIAFVRFIMMRVKCLLVRLVGWLTCRGRRGKMLRRRIQLRISRCLIRRARRCSWSAMGTTATLNSSEGVNITQIQSLFLLVGQTRVKHPHYHLLLLVLQVQQFLVVGGAPLEQFGLEQHLVLVLGY